MNERTPLVVGSSNTPNDIGGRENEDDEQHPTVTFDLASFHEEDEDVHEQRRPRSESHGSVLEIAFDAIVETVETAKETVVEGLETAKETVVEGFEEVHEILEENVTIPVKPREEGEHHNKLSAMALAILVFYKVSGGPFGCEPAVKAGGPFFALLGFILFPLVWSVPEALVTAELGSAYPEPSGGELSGCPVVVDRRRVISMS